MKKKDNIELNKDRFKSFKKTLKSECNLLSTNGTFDSLQNLDTVISDVEELQEYYLEQLYELTEIRGEDFKTNISSFHNSFIEGFAHKNDMFKHLHRESKSFFFARKIHQLSHAHGLYEGNIKKSKDISDDIKNYYAFILFLDYYESFPVFIHPMVKKLWKDKAGHIWTKRRYWAQDYYDMLNELCPPKGLFTDKPLALYNALRNKIAHSSIIFLDGEFCININEREFFYYVNRKKVYIREISELHRIIEGFQKMIIIMATEFDLQILRLANQRDDEVFKNWIQYFSIYNDDWQRIG